MKTLWNAIVTFVKREWFLLISISVIVLIVLLFELL